MRNVRRLICLVLLLIISAVSAFSVCAEGNLYYISDLGMSIEIPSYMSVSTKDTNPDMTNGIYLAATCSAPDLDIRVLMQEDAKTEEFFNLSLLSSSALDEYKDALLLNPEYSDCTEGTYGGVLFLDFSTYDSVGDTTVYGRQSVTVVNGMSIVISSTSDGDALTSDEIALIRGVMESVKFDKILSNAPKVSFWSIFVPVVIVLLVLALGFLVLSYFMGKKSREAKRRRQRERERRADYDVLKRAEKPKSAEGLGGYRTSGAFFDDAFDEDSKINSATSQKVSAVSSDTPANGFAKEGRKALKSTGYFFTNLKRELSKNKRKKQEKRKNPSKSKKPKARDYDIFND